jgi:hypothetical protein
VLESIDEVLKALKIFRKRFKSILKFKHNFRLLKNLLPIFREALQIVGSLVNEVLFIHNIIKFVIKCILLLMSKYVLIARVIYVLYLILLSIFGVLLGFLLCVYKRDETEQFSKFSLKTIEQINTRPLKIILKEPNQRP